MNKRLVVAVCCLLFVTVAVASEYTTDSLEEARLSEQIVRLQKTLRMNERGASTWWKTWTALYAVGTIAQGGIALTTSDKSVRQDMIVGAGTTILGVASQLITPVSTDFHPVGVDSISKLSYIDKQRLLSQGEANLKKQAEIAEIGKGWQVHALSGAVNLASGLITWIGFNRSFGEGVLNFALNSVITETQIWTQPIRAKKAYERYLQANEQGFECPTTSSAEWYGQVSTGSCTLGIRF
ncbi:MAG TPA: hypothetical protein VFP20_10625 [Bacteroidales bacterium]|nr:hypothetical protein [Bacteroidales bacterium]